MKKLLPILFGLLLLCSCNDNYVTVVDGVNGELIVTREEYRNDTTSTYTINSTKINEFGDVGYIRLFDKPGKFKIGEKVQISNITE